MTGSTGRGECQGKCASKVIQVETEVEMAGLEGKAQPHAIFGMSHGR